MNFSISNLSWNCQDEEIYPILQNNNVKNIEISLTKQFGDWGSIKEKNLIKYKNSLKERGFNISSVQSIFYQKDYNLFKKTPVFIEHFKKVLDYCELLDCKYVVFGSPKIRNPYDLSCEDAEKIFIEAFNQISDYSKEVIIGIETNPKVYGCKYITDYKKCKQILRKINKQNIKFHLDTACVYLEGDDPVSIFSTEKNNLNHIHLSCKNLQTIYNDRIVNDIVKIAASNSLNSCLSVEMLKISKEEINLIFQELNNIFELHRTKNRRLP